MTADRTDPALGVAGVAERAGVDEAFVRRLMGLGALPPDEAALGSREVRRTRLLASWERAGLSTETIVELVGRGALSLSWLDAPVMDTPERLERTTADLAAERGVDLALIQRLHQALGFAPPRPEDLAGEDDVVMLDIADMFRAAGVDDEATARLVAVYAESLRRIAQAEAEYYETNIERRLRASGLDERALMDAGARLGNRVVPSLERLVLAIYRRHREHVWTEHAINHVDEALADAGLEPALASPPAICFVDLTGYTRMTEMRGDEEAARVAAELAVLVKDISRRRGGRPIRWLGDGGMFHFRDPAAAVLAGLDMVEAAPAAGLPQAHIGIHTGPVISQDGDVYGRTVNVASRIASFAQAGEVVVSEETRRLAGDDGVRFDPVGPVELKGLGAPIPLHRALRG
jgi:adenylate cyclase